MQLLTYGLYFDELKHISEVQNGLHCGCVCPNCKHPLVAKNNPNNKKAIHFAHHLGKECEGAVETAIHLLAKNVLLKLKQLVVPKYHFDYNPYNLKSLFKESIQLKFDKIILEQVVIIDGEKIIPDAICEINGRQIYIEFAKTHFVDEHKKSKILKSDVACIEIDLLGQVLDENKIIDFLISDTPFKYWIINKKNDREYQRLKEQKKLKKEQKRFELEQKKLNIEREKRIKLEKYKNLNKYKILKIDDWGYAPRCPLKKVALNDLKLSNFYEHPILKRLIDGEFWNGEMYGRRPNGTHIYVKGIKIIVYPSDNYKMTDEEITKNGFFYKGLRMIQEITNSSKYGDCKNCDFHVDSLSDCTVCKYGIH